MAKLNKQGLPIFRRGECFQVQEYQVDFWFLGYAWTQKPEVYLVQYEY